MTRFGTAMPTPPKPRCMDTPCILTGTPLSTNPRLASNTAERTPTRADTESTTVGGEVLFEVMVAVAV